MLPMSITEACANITDILEEILDLQAVILTEVLDFTSSDAVGVIASEFSVHASIRNDLRELLFELVVNHNVLTAPAQIAELFNETREHVLLIVKDAVNWDTEEDPEAALIIEDVHAECCEGIGELGALLRDLVTDVTKQISAQNTIGLGSGGEVPIFK